MSKYVAVATHNFKWVKIQIIYLSAGRLIVLNDNVAFDCSTLWWLMSGDWSEQRVYLALLNSVCPSPRPH